MRNDLVPEIVIAGGVYAVKGSANRFPPGERPQENGPRLSRNAVIAAVTRAILGPNHDFMLKQMAGPTLDVTALLGPEDTGRDAPAATRPGGLRRPKVI
jgi:hypothetical protein